MSDNFSIIKGILTILQAKDVCLEYHHFIISAYPSAELAKDFWTYFFSCHVMECMYFIYAEEKKLIY